MKKFLKQGALGILFFIILNAVIAIFYQNKVNKTVQNKTHRKHLRWNDMHENRNEYDLIIIGTSRAYDSYSPTILDSILNTQSYNMSTAAQDIVESYYSLKEIFEYQKPKYIIFDLFYEASDDKYEYYQTISNASFFNSLKNRINLITEAYGTTGIANYSIPLLRFKNYIKQDIDLVFKDSKKDKKEDQLIKGYLYNTVTITDEEITNFNALPKLEDSNFDENRFNTYFNKIKELVAANNAKLICVRAPYPPSRLTLSTIDEENDYYTTFMSHADIPYFDLNSFENDRYTYIDQDFADYHHPNYRGAEKASMQLADIIKQIKK